MADANTYKMYNDYSNMLDEEIVILARNCVKLMNIK